MSWGKWQRGGVRERGRKNLFCSSYSPPLTLFHVCFPPLSISRHFPVSTVHFAWNRLVPSGPESSFECRCKGLQMSFSLNATDCKHLKVIIISMASNKAPGIDKIPIRVIKDSLGSILPVLTSVINTSIASNMFPTMETSRSDSNTKRYGLYKRTRVTMGRSRFCRLFRKAAGGSSIINSHHSLRQRGGCRTIKAETRNSIQQKRPSSKQQT